MISNTILSQRLAQHRNDFKKGKVSTSLSEIIEGGNYDIVLVENFPCNLTQELNARTRHWIFCFIRQKAYLLVF